MMVGETNGKSNKERLARKKGEGEERKNLRKKKSAKAHEKK